MSAKEERTIKSARRVLEILEYFDREHPTATVMDMSRALNYPQSSTSELLRSLTRLGYLHYNRYRRIYSPKARLALLGAWVDPTLFRGGCVLDAVDRIADLVGETVLLSTSTNYFLQHLHVVRGASEHSVDGHAGQTESLLHNHLGRLILASYRDAHIRTALHRLNAEEADPDRRVNVAETFDELVALRRQGWLMQPNALDNGIGLISILLPSRRGIERLALSVVATTEVIETRGDEILKIMLEQRGRVLPQPRPEPAPPTVMRATIGSDFKSFTGVDGTVQENHTPRSLVA